MALLTATFHTDADQQSKPERFRGKKYFHPKTGHLYVVTGFRIDSQREVWLLDYELVCDDRPTHEQFAYSHTIKDFTREGRFLEVKG